MLQFAKKPFLNVCPQNSARWYTLWTHGPGPSRACAIWACQRFPSKVALVLLADSQQVFY